MPVREYPGHVNHVERSPCHPPRPQRKEGRWLLLDGRGRHDTHAVPMRNYAIGTGELRDGEPFMAEELRDPGWPGFSVTAFTAPAAMAGCPAAGAGSAGH